MHRNFTERESLFLNWNSIVLPDVIIATLLRNDGYIHQPFLCTTMDTCISHSFILLRYDGNCHKVSLKLFTVITRIFFFAWLYSALLCIQLLKYIYIYISRKSVSILHRLHTLLTCNIVGNLSHACWRAYDHIKIVWWLSEPSLLITSIEHIYERKLGCRAWAGERINLPA